MNQLAHIFINYSILSLFFVESRSYLLAIVIFSIILDLDHIPGYIKVICMKKEQKKKLQIPDYIDLFRTAIQEPIGVITTSLVLLSIYYFVQETVILIAISCILLHWLVDFLTVHTRPYDPLSKKVVSLWFHTKKQRMVSEVTITLIAGVCFIITYW